MSLPLGRLVLPRVDYPKLINDELDKFNDEIKLKYQHEVKEYFIEDLSENATKHSRGGFKKVSYYNTSDGKELIFVSPNAAALEDIKYHIKTLLAYFEFQKLYPDYKLNCIVPNLYKIISGNGKFQCHSMDVLNCIVNASKMYLLAENEFIKGYVELNIIQIYFAKVFPADSEYCMIQETAESPKKVGVFDFNNNFNIEKDINIEPLLLANIGKRMFQREMPKGDPFTKMDKLEIYLSKYDNEIKFLVDIYNSIMSMIKQDHKILTVDYFIKFMITDSKKGLIHNIKLQAKQQKNISLDLNQFAGAKSLKSTKSKKRKHKKNKTNKTNKTNMTNKKHQKY